MINLTIQVTKQEMDKLLKLAEARGRSVEDCIRGFARSCQPGGSGWVHPSKVRVPADATDEEE